MAKAKNKTQASSDSVEQFIQTLPTEKEQQQATELLALFKEATGVEPTLWGSMIGFGSYHYKYESGREGHHFASGFAIRKSGPTIYIMPGYQDYSSLLKDLGPHKLGKCCLYLKKLEGIDTDVLKILIKQGIEDLKKIYPVTL